MITCKLTGDVGEPVQAHIIPRSFYDLSPEAGVTRMVSSAPDEYPKRAPIGAYDCGMVTAVGERVFTQWDRYAYELLVRDRARLQRVAVAGEPTLFTVAGFDYPKLKLFFLSVLWRAAATTHPFFRRTKLGPHELSIRQMLLAGDPGSPEQYSVHLATYWDKPDGPGMLDPQATRFAGVNYYRMYVGPYIVYLKIDKRPTPEPFDEGQLRPNAPLVVYAREFASSNERPAMLRVAQQHARRER